MLSYTDNNRALLCGYKAIINGLPNSCELSYPSEYCAGLDSWMPISSDSWMPTSDSNWAGIFSWLPTSVP